MTTVVNTPGGSGSDNSGIGFLVGIVLAVALAAMFFMFVWPTLRGNQPPTQKDTIDVNVKLPDAVVPDKSQQQ